MLAGAAIGRLAIVAGSGQLPMRLAEAAREAGHTPFVLPIIGAADQDWSGFAHADLAIADLASFAAITRREEISHAVLSGGIARRPGLGEFRPTWRMIPAVPRIFRALVSGGDDAVLRSVIGLLESVGVKVVGAHEVVPGLLATGGPLGAVSPDAAACRDIAAAARAALELGRLDIGQGAISVGGRVIALEGLEGTDDMLARVARLRAEGRLPAGRRGVLVKLCKPMQDMRADLPSIGPGTVENAGRAGLAGIAVEAGRALVLDRDALIAAADRAGIFVSGIDPADLAP
ncbi:hypothetical protein DFR52_101371 [Hoeflea marina]|uniref:Phosphatidate cytidylyltransferase n=1 Tax=Hoeflea marina TaxID=274592 RepID=A0A317PSH3_9HYPH|nr:UDP-2,3-diacylglucosamine diphosphatase LpxI [Hoeflea marina]PWW03685.1 hypothetical protein DFR52_101371 [Hoeflea marina]